MKTATLSGFRQIWFVDFEFSVLPGERPNVICMVAHEWRTGQVLKIWENDLLQYSRPPFSIANDCLYVAFYASAEFSCHIALGWCLPSNVVDLFVENRNLTNGLYMPRGNGLLGALFHHGINSIDHEEKVEMRDLAIRGGPWTSAEKKALLDYCHSDVVALRKLFDRLIPILDLPRAMIRGRYMKAVAIMESNGIPIDADRHRLLVDNSEAIRSALIDSLGRNYDVYEAGSFRAALFQDYLRREEIPWPRLPSGAPCLTDQAFSSMSMRYPQLENLKLLRSQLNQLQLKPLPIGSDGRNRCLLSPFSSKTGRNQPSSGNFVFGRAKWTRSLIKPGFGRALLYLDYVQQEFGIAAALSGDRAMQEAYDSGDPYLSFAIHAGAAPTSATKATHRSVRDIYKACVLATQYGMGAESLSVRIGKCALEAQTLLRTHRLLYSDYWSWSEAAISYASLSNRIYTVFGWQLNITHKTNVRTIQNYPMQANGAEMLRLACCFLCENGVTVCAPIHDAVLVECNIDDVPEIIDRSKSAMARASRVVLGGVELKTDVTITRYPESLGNDRGDKIWTAINAALSH